MQIKKATGQYPFLSVVLKFILIFRTNVKSLLKHGPNQRYLAQIEASHLGVGFFSWGFNVTMCSTQKKIAVVQCGDYQ